MTTPVDEAGSSKRILLVDDDASLRAVVAETLRGEGYAVDEASDGAEALEQLRAAPPDLVLLDLAMPVVDGHGFIAAWHAQENRGDIPIIILSATPALPDAPQEAGVKAILLKPFDVGVLLAM